MACEATSSSVKVRVPILTSIRHAAGVLYVRSSISRITRRPVLCFTSRRLTRCLPTPSAARSSVLYCAASDSGVSFISVPWLVLRKLATCPEMTARRRSSSFTSIFWYSSADRRPASSGTTHGCSLTCCSDERSPGLFRSMPAIRSMSSASLSPCTSHLHSSSVVTIAMSSCWSSAAYGREPKTIACSVMPSDHTSATVPM
mmetsp:Transcript_12823/g.21915  ORF Transcript_12823/g.21915 Transcript_12823/m.21915 type:complete len:201 (-) Transcript_12823:320-922(-)